MKHLDNILCTLFLFCQNLPAYIPATKACGWLNLRTPSDPLAGCMFACEMWRLISLIRAVAQPSACTPVTPLEESRMVVSRRVELSTNNTFEARRRASSTILGAHEISSITHLTYPATSKVPAPHNPTRTLSSKAWLLRRNRISSLALPPPQPVGGALAARLIYCLRYRRTLVRLDQHGADWPKIITPSTAAQSRPTCRRWFQGPEPWQHSSLQPV